MVNSTNELASREKAVGTNMEPLHNSHKGKHPTLMRHLGVRVQKYLSLDTASPSQALRGLNDEVEDRRNELVLAFPTVLTSDSTVKVRARRPNSSK